MIDGERGGNGEATELSAGLAPRPDCCANMCADERRHRLHSANADTLTEPRRYAKRWGTRGKSANGSIKTLDDTLRSLKEMRHPIELEESVRAGAERSLRRMLELSA